VTIELWRAAREILFREWDPICVNSNEKLADEYDDIVPRVVDAVREGRSVAALAQLLLKEERALQCSTDEAKRAYVARLLHDLKVRY
jgi:hypothetical protein